MSKCGHRENPARIVQRPGVADIWIGVACIVVVVGLGVYWSIVNDL
jgi:hypothetical protein